jgi:crotonobetainyl-CoA:carnitine CoA-transferase CaiB-like acyl-CoA transferase
MRAPLAGVVVADLTQNVAGPYCTQILGDMGADVVKVERPGRGDDARAWAPPYWGEESSTFMAVNRHKRSLAVDLATPEGREVVGRLVARADVFVQSLRAGAAEGLGFGWQRMRALNPRLVYCSVTAFGSEGPLRDRPGYDPLMQAYGGIMSFTGHPGQPPVRVPLSIVDMGTGMWAATAILGALRVRDVTGRGMHVTTALFETALAWTAVQANQYFATGEAPRPQGSGTAMIVPYEAFPTHEGDWVMIAAGSDTLFARTCEALGVPGLARDPRFADNPARVQNRAALVDALAAVSRNLSATDLLDRLERAGVPAAPILTVDRVAAHPQTTTSGMFAPAPHPRLPDYRAVGMPVRWDGARPGPGRVPPLLGEHTAELLAELGYEAGAIEELVARKVVQAGSGNSSPAVASGNLSPAVDARQPEAAGPHRP